MAHSLCMFSELASFLQGDCSFLLMMQKPWWPVCTLYGTQTLISLLYPSLFCGVLDRNKDSELQQQLWHLDTHMIIQVFAQQDQVFFADPIAAGKDKNTCKDFKSLHFVHAPWNGISTVSLWEAFSYCILIYSYRCCHQEFMKSSVGRPHGKLACCCYSWWWRRWQWSDTLWTKDSHKVMTAALIVMVLLDFFVVEISLQFWIYEQEEEISIVNCQLLKQL